MTHKFPTFSNVDSISLFKEKISFHFDKTKFYMFFFSIFISVTMFFCYTFYRLKQQMNHLIFLNSQLQSNLMQMEIDIQLLNNKIVQSQGVAQHSVFNLSTSFLSLEYSNPRTWILASACLIAIAYTAKLWWVGGASALKLVTECGQSQINVVTAIKKNLGKNDSLTHSVNDNSLDAYLLDVIVKASIPIPTETAIPTLSSGDVGTNSSLATIATTLSVGSKYPSL